MIAYVPKAACRQGQWTMIGLLVTVAIIMILAAAYYPRIAAEHSQPGEALTPKERAYGAGCEIYASQMNDAVAMYKQDHDDHPPTDLNELKKYGVTDDMINAKGCSFQINPVSGIVSDTGEGRSQPQVPGDGTEMRHHGRRYNGGGNPNGPLPNNGGQDPNAPFGVSAQSQAPASGNSAPQAPYGGASQAAPYNGGTPQAAPQASGPEDDTATPSTNPPVHINIPNVSGSGF